MLEKIQKVKLEKLNNLKEAGMDLYPEKSERSFSNGEALDKFDERAEPLRELAKYIFTRKR